MKRKIISILLVLSLVIVGMLSTASMVAAGKSDGPVGPGDDDAFLCPWVGNANAAAHNGQGWIVIGDEGQGWSFFPGNNQAGAHANPNSWNDVGPGASKGPSNDINWSPIWPNGGGG